jgi:uncharacterized protein YdaU (DUF1376 family)
MHYWQHAALPSDEARLAAITGLSVAQWRRIREPVAAKFADGWKHKRIEAELAKINHTTLQRRLAGQRGGIKSGIARAVAQGEAIIRAQARAEAQTKRELARRSSESEAKAPAKTKPPRTNHNQRINSSFSSDEGTTRPGEPKPPDHKPADHKPASQWSRQELEALFARRGTVAAQQPAADAAPDPSPQANGD